MKKRICMILSLILMLSLAACGGAKTGTQTSQTPAGSAAAASAASSAKEEEPAASASSAEETAGTTSSVITDAVDTDASAGAEGSWTRQGMFADEDTNLFMVQPSDDEDMPGWYVGVLLDEAMYGGTIPEEGASLHGELDDSSEDGTKHMVTITEEGEDGLLFVFEGGETYHLTPYSIPEAAFSVTVNTEGFGEIAYAKEGEEIAFDDEYPSQSAYIGLEGPETYTFAARPDEGYKFRKWTVNGETISKDPEVTLEITEDTELIAVFGPKGTDETPVDLDQVTTLGQVLGLPDYGSASYGKRYVYAFEQDDVIYRAVADFPEEIADAYYALDWDDEEYETKKRELIGQLEVLRIENLTESAPSQEEMDALVGKTVQELFDEGWYNSGWNFEDMVLYMNHGIYSFNLGFETEITDYSEFDDDDLGPLVVTSVEYTGLGDLTALSDEEAYGEEAAE